MGAPVNRQAAKVVAQQADRTPTDPRPEIDRRYGMPVPSPTQIDQAQKPLVGQNLIRAMRSQEARRDG